MKEQRDNFFCISKDQIKEVKYIWLTKKASYEEYFENTFKDSGVVEDSDKSMQFYAFGFYDSLACIKTSMATSMANKKHFHIVPSEKMANTLKVEQWFGIFPLSEDAKYQRGTGTVGEEPFFCSEDLQSELPFLGIILISLDSSTDDFKQFLKNYTDRIEKILTEESDDLKRLCPKYLAETYYSLNCVDLCLAIRTDQLPFIHWVNYMLNGIAEQRGESINTTVLFALQSVSCLEDRLKEMGPKNKEVSFVIRSNLQVDDSKKESKGVNGTGKYVTTFSYEEYSDILANVLTYKINSEPVEDAYSKSICHEREWFDEEAYSAVFEKKKEDTKYQNFVCKWIADVHQKILKIKQIAADLFLFSKKAYKFKEMFACEFRLLIDLANTYSDLWYQNASESGFVFYVQLWIALHGLETMLNEIKQLGSDVGRLEPSIENLLNVMHQIVCDLNGYNKQFQLLNQDSVNFPIYEIQSKVNAEKYMAAYCSFLHRFFALYYQQKKQDNMADSMICGMPLALVDLNQKKIEAKFYFELLNMEYFQDENNSVRNLFAIHFPSSEYFSNVWDSIPLIMHEVSHASHYGKTVYRNKAVLYNINQFFSEMLANSMLSSVSDGIGISTSAFLAKLLKESIYDAISEEQEEYFKEVDIRDFGHWRFLDLKDICTNFYCYIFEKVGGSKSVTYSQFESLKEKMKQDVDVLVKILGFEKICFAFNEKMNCPSAMYYFINVLYLEFNPSFYKRYQQKYDNEFLIGLYKEADVEERDEIEQSMLCLALYRFAVYVKGDEKAIPKDMKEDVEKNIDDFLYISISVVSISSMWSVFEQYRKGFSDDLPEKYFCRELHPRFEKDDILTYEERLSKAYKAFVEEFQPSLLEKKQMEQMLYEYYEIYQCTNNILRFFMEGIVCNEQKNGLHNFIKCVHSKCRGKIHKLEEEDCFKAAFSKSNRGKMVRLGLFEEESAILEDVFKATLLKSGNKIIKTEIDDRYFLFQEVYADCGMCCSMGFDPFGYCMFTVQIYNSLNGLQNATIDYKFLPDRLRSVIRMYFDEGQMEDLASAYKEFFEKLFDASMILSICKKLFAIWKKVEEKPQGRGIEELHEICSEINVYISDLKWNGSDLKELIKIHSLKHKITLWRDDILGVLLEIIESAFENLRLTEEQRDWVTVAKSYLFCVYNVIDVFVREDILRNLSDDIYDGFFQKLKIIMDKDLGIASVRNDPCVKEIKSFYNMECPKEAEDKFEWYYNVYSSRFVSECNFIFDNYCEHRNAYHHLKEKMMQMEDDEKLFIKEWFGLLDEYYINRFKPEGVD